MPTKNPKIPALSLRRLPLSACLIAALGGVSSSSAQTSTPASGKHVAHPAATHSVNTCADDNSPKSLRSLIATANSGDTIDFADLPAGCTKITLSSTNSPQHLVIPQASLYIKGPGQELLTIDGNFEASVFRHTGSGTLDIRFLTIAHGALITDTEAQGGCIYSAGNLQLAASTVTGCGVVATGMARANGGGVHVDGDLDLHASSITDSAVWAVGSSYAGGGGASVFGSFTASYSTVDGNEAAGYHGAYGGGLFLAGTSKTIQGSTISANRASIGGGVYSAEPVSTMDIINSTISGNRAESVAGALIFGDTKVRNSTIAFNHDTAASTASGLAIAGTLKLESSIFSGNGGLAGASDLGGFPTSFTGSHNLVHSTALVTPADTLTACARLQQLADNGGLTRTHAPMHGSVAIDAGSNPALLTTDQTNNPRKFGPQVDIGSVEWKGDPDEQIFVSGFDGLCDQ